MLHSNLTSKQYLICVVKKILNTNINTIVNNTYLYFFSKVYDCLRFIFSIEFNIIIKLQNSLRI